MPVQKTLTINIPQPCHENWIAMQPSGCSRFCAQCEKIVIDFTDKSDEEIIKIFVARKDNPPCGRFSEVQLNRPLVMMEESKAFHLSRVMAKVAAAFLLVPTFLQHSFAQAKQAVETEQFPSFVNKKPVILKGKVTDELSGKPLVAMEISIDKLDYVEYSDKDGNFSFALPDSLRDKQITIKADYQPTSSQQTENSIIEPVMVVVSDSWANTVLKLKRAPFEKLDSANIEVLSVQRPQTIIMGAMRSPEPIIKAKATLLQRVKWFFKGKHR